MDTIEVRKSRLTRIELLNICIANVGVVLFCFTRAIAYSEVLGEAKFSPGPHLLSDDGRFLVLYALLWGIAGLFALYDLVRRQLGFGFTMLIPLMIWWGISYTMAWAYSDYHSYDWMSAAVYFGSALGLIGLFGSYVMARRKNELFFRTYITTGNFSKVKGRDT